MLRNILKNIFIFIIFILFFLAYILTLRGIYGNPQGAMIKNNLDQATKPFELSPERNRFILTYSLAEYKSFALTQELADAAYPDVGYYKGKFYIFFTPGVSLLALPLYLIGKTYNLSQVFSFFISSLFAFLNLILLFKISRSIFKLSAWQSTLASLIFGFATSSWSYAITLYQHHISTFFILMSFYSVWKFTNNIKKRWIWGSFVWLLFGYSIVVDYPNFILMSPIILYFFISAFQIQTINKSLEIFFRSSFLTTFILFLMVVGLYAFYNYKTFGDIKGVGTSLVSYKSIKEGNLFERKDKKQQTKNLFQKTSLKNYFKEDSLPRGFSILLFSRDRGLFLYTPIFILALLGIYSIRKTINLEIATLLGLIGVNLFLYSSWADPWGGWAYGPRYLIPSMAILSIFIGVWLNNAKYKMISKVVTFFLFAYSSFIALLGALTTNQVPPKVEADFLKMKYNFLLNWDFFMDGRSGSFVFNEFASKFMNLQVYFLVIYISLILLVFSLLFIVPLFVKKHES